jgi:hypothetical protein
LHNYHFFFGSSKLTFLFAFLYLLTKKKTKNKIIIAANIQPITKPEELLEIGWQVPMQHAPFSAACVGTVQAVVSLQNVPLS